MSILLSIVDILMHHQDPKPDMGPLKEVRLLPVSGPFVRERVTTLIQHSYRVKILTLSASGRKVFPLEYYPLEYYPQEELLWSKA